MISRWLTILNYVLAGIILFLGLGMAILWFKNPSEVICSDPKDKSCSLPKSAFQLSSEAYQAMGGELLALQHAPPTLLLPDLRQQLIYYGKNGRPDAQSQHTLLHFSLNGNKTVVSVVPGDRLYLFYDKKTTPARYNISPNNEKTSLWIEGTPAETDVLVKVTLENEKGEPLVEPECCRQFRLAEKEFIRYAGASWELGGFRVDGTLLARQRARWFGPDRFLEKHGGEEYKDCEGKQRIDLGENDEIYSAFVKVNDCLIWDQGKWKVVDPGEKSRHHPLLIVKKVDERLMTFELWDVEGKGKILLNLLKSAEPWLVHNAQQIQQMFKFVGARTRSQCVFEINNERMVVRPSDWLLLTPKGWKKLTESDEIDDYVKRKTTGTLFVFEGMARKDERQVMMGMLYNPTRSDCQVVELSMQPAGTHQKKLVVGKENKEGKEVAEGMTMTERGVNLLNKLEGELGHHLPPMPPMPHKHQSSNP